MAYTKEQIYNLALSALLLQRRVIDATTDTSNEVKVLNSVYDVAVQSALQDMDLDSTATVATLELIETDPTTQWLYSYKYPSDCAFFRRIQSGVLKDNRYTAIERRIAVRAGVKCVLTNQEAAIAEYISFNVALTTVSASAGMAIAYRLATLAAPLVTGKGASNLIKDIEAKFIATKALAQEQDALENYTFDQPEIASEFVYERMT